MSSIIKCADEPTLCRHSIGCRVSVQNLIRAEDVRGRFELGQNPVYSRFHRAWQAKLNAHRRPMEVDARENNPQGNSDARFSYLVRIFGACARYQAHLGGRRWKKR